MKSFEANLKPQLGKETEHKKKHELETEFLSEIEKHDGLYPESKKAIAEKIVRLEKLKAGAPEKVANEKNILRAGIQNIAIRERLSQKNGPVSLSAQDFKNIVSGYDKDLAEEHFGPEAWGGISSATRAAELDLAGNSELAGKQIIFCDELDANDVTDYILAGKEQEAGREVYTLKLVQVGSSMKYKGVDEVRQQHQKLADNLSGDVSIAHALEAQKKEILDLLADIADFLKEKTCSLESIGRALLLRHFGADRDEYGSLAERLADVAELSSVKRRALLRDVERLVFLAQQESNITIEEGFFADVQTKDLSHSDISQIRTVLVEELSAAGLVKKIPICVKSRIMARFDNNDRVTAENQDAELAIDKDKFSVYAMDLDTLIRTISSKQQHVREKEKAA